jgi:glycosyltransferase involved in cell wall biosynthesis
MNNAEVQNAPFFSIVIPTYNREKCILNTLDTVFSQTFRDYEVIVVDNCSTDQTELVLSEFISSGKIKFIKHDKNYERAKSRNTGMKAARGNFLTFLDSDDFMYPSNLHDAYDFIQSNPQTKIFYNLSETVNEEKIRIRFQTQKYLPNAIEMISKGNFLSCIGNFIHKDIYKTIFWDENPELTGTEDYEFWLRVIAHYPLIGRINKINNGMLEHPGRSVNNDFIDKAKLRAEYMLTKIKEDKYLSEVYHEKYFNNIKSTLYSYMSYMGRLANNPKEMYENLIVAIKYNKSLLLKRSTYMTLLLAFLKK